jgi:hypothetical protein
MTKKISKYQIFLGSYQLALLRFFAWCFFCLGIVMYAWSSSIASEDPTTGLKRQAVGGFNAEIAKISDNYRIAYLSCFAFGGVFCLSAIATDRREDKRLKMMSEKKKSNQPSEVVRQGEK